MLELATTSVTIIAPIARVFKYVSNMENYRQWFPGVINIKSANNLAHGEIGKTYVETLSLPNGNAELEIKVVQCKANQLFLTKGNLAGVLPQMTVTFTDNENQSCTLHLQYHSRNAELSSNSEIILALQENLKIRATHGVLKLKVILEQT